MKASGFSLHTGVTAAAYERQKLERLYPLTGQSVAVQIGIPVDLSSHISWHWCADPRVNLSHYNGIFSPIVFLIRVALD